MSPNVTLADILEACVENVEVVARNEINIVAHYIRKTTIKEVLDLFKCYLVGCKYGCIWWNEIEKNCELKEKVAALGESK